MAGNYSNTGSWVPQVNTVGLRNVGSYQVSGHPFVTGSTVNQSVNSGGLYIAAGEHKIQFPYVSQSLLIENHAASTAGNPLRLHFRATGDGNVIAGNHFISIDRGTSVSIQAKCKEIYLSVANASNVSYTVIAELTNIPPSRMYELTGSGITE